MGTYFYYCLGIFENTAGHSELFTLLEKIKVLDYTSTEYDRMYWKFLFDNPTYFFIDVQSISFNNRNYFIFFCNFYEGGEKFLYNATECFGDIPPGSVNDSFYFVNQDPIAQDNALYNIVIYSAENRFSETLKQLFLEDYFIKSSINELHLLKDKYLSVLSKITTINKQETLYRNYVEFQKSIQRIDEVLADKFTWLREGDALPEIAEIFSVSDILNNVHDVDGSCISDINNFFKDFTFNTLKPQCIVDFHSKWIGLISRKFKDYASREELELISYLINISTSQFNDEDFDTVDFLNEFYSVSIDQNWYHFSYNISSNFINEEIIKSFLTELVENITFLINNFRSLMKESIEFYSLQIQKNFWYYPYLIKDDTYYKPNNELTDGLWLLFDQYKESKFINIELPCLLHLLPQSCNIIKKQHPFFLTRNQDILESTIKRKNEQSLFLQNRSVVDFWKIDVFLQLNDAISVRKNKKYFKFYLTNLDNFLEKKWLIFSSNKGEDSKYQDSENMKSYYHYRKEIEEYAQLIKTTKYK